MSHTIASDHTFPPTNPMTETHQVSYRYLERIFFIIRHQEGSDNAEGLKLNGARNILVYADDVNILRGSVHTIKKNTEALIGASKEIGLEVNADKTKYVVMSREQNAGRSHSTKIGLK